MANVLKTYKEMKEKHPDAMLLFRCGDFYQLFNDDARTAAKELNLTLAYFHNDPQTATCVFPHHALDTYLPMLVRNGHRIAICDMPTDPPKRLVRRGSDELTTTAINNPTNNPQTTETMKLSINNTTNTESKNTVNNIVPAAAVCQPVQAAEAAEPIRDAVAEEVNAPEPTNAPEPPKGERNGKAQKVTIKRKKAESVSEQPAQVSTPLPDGRGQGVGLLPKVQFSTYKTKRGDTAPQIIGFASEDDPRWKAHKDAGHKYVSASFRRDLNGEKVYILLFGVRYMDVAKALCGAYNTDDRDAWRRAEDACMAIYEQAQRDGKARWEAKKAQWAEKKAEKAAQKVADEQAKKCYSKEDVAAMLADVLAGKDVPEDIKKLLAA